MAINKRFYWLILILIFLAGCSSGQDTEVPTGELVPTEISLPTALPADTATPLSPVGVFITPQGSDPKLVEELNPLVGEYIKAEGLRYQVLEIMSVEDFQRDDFRLVIVLPPYPDLETLVQGAPATKFLAVGFNDIDPQENLSVLRFGGGNFDVQGFVAGYIAAMITTDWRVAVLSIQESEDALAAREGFRVGVKYFCGLCNPQYAPAGINYIYPKYIDLPVEATELEIEVNVNILIDRAVNTYYIVPGAGNEQIYRMLVNNNKLIIGPGIDFSEEYRDNWVASLEYDLVAAFNEIWPMFISTDTGIEHTPPLLFTD
ncbi:MAG: hypothetical protein MUO54_17100, partial [Anaerolineales bacterium]|nr:hypothetical protein [Anaerolineales bacterium]